MFRVKKISSISLMLTICVSLATAVFASSPTNDTQKTNASASIIYADGTVAPLESVVTVEDIRTTNGTTMKLPIKLRYIQK